MLQILLICSSSFNFESNVVSRDFAPMTRVIGRLLKGNFTIYDNFQRNLL